MSELATMTPAECGVDVSDNTALNAAFGRAARDALLTHARMGRSVPQGTPERGVVWVTPAEIFARYGLDEFGRPLPGAADAPVTLEAEAGRQE